MYIREIDQPLGYTLETVAESMDIFKAEEILSSRRQRRYSRVLRRGMEAQLERHLWICPFCGEHIPAYPCYFSKATIYKPLLREEIHNCLSPQLSMFERSDSLTLNKPIGCGKWGCPKCGRSSGPSHRTRQVRYTVKRGQLQISVKLEGLEDVLCLRWPQKPIMSLCLPLTEKIVFNFRKGRVYLKLHDAWGRTCAGLDITQIPEAWNSGVLYDILTNSKANRRAFKKGFAMAYGKKLPFPDCELSLDKLVAMTRFIGYSPDFYCAIPYLEDSCRIDSSFRRAASILHRADRVPRLYDESQLPQVKSVKRVFYENAGLLFYLDECIKLWQLIGDVNVYHRLISCSSIYDILSRMHIYPGVEDYYRDYAAAKGPAAFARLIMTSFLQVNNKAITYRSMSVQARKMKRDEWKKKKPHRKLLEWDGDLEEYHDEDHRYTAAEYGPGSVEPPVIYSIPMHSTDRQIDACIIDGCCFAWLRSSNEYRAAGRALKNCLVRWEKDQNPVVAVRKEGRIVAAIEIDPETHTVIQKAVAGNRYIEAEPGLAQAYSKWKTRLRLSEKTP